MKRDWVVLAIVFLGAVLLQHPAFFMGGVVIPKPAGRLWLYPDEATVAYDAARIAMGQVMYRDFFQFQGPVHYHLYALLFAVVGRSFFASRLLFVVSTAISAVFIAVLVRRAIADGRRGASDLSVPERGAWWSPSTGTLAGVAAGWTHSAALVPFWPCAYPHWTAEMLALGGLVVLTSGRSSRRTRVGAGACLGASAWTIASLGIPALVAAAGAQALGGLQRRSMRLAVRPVLEVLAGGALVSVPVIVYFGAAGALPDLWYDTWVWPFESYGRGQTDLRGYATQFRSVVREHAALGAPWAVLGRVVAELVRDLPLLAFLGLLPAAGVALDRVLKPRDQAADSVELCRIGLVAVGAAVASPLVLQVSRTDMVHLAFVGSFGLVAAAALWGLMVRRDLGATLGTGLFGLIALIVIASYLGMVGRTERDLRDRRTYLLELEPTQKILPHLDEGSLLFDTGYWGGLRYFYLRDAAVPVTWIPSGAFGYYTTEQWTSIADALVEKRPSVLHTSPAVFAHLARHAPELRRLYRAIGSNLYDLGTP